MSDLHQLRQLMEWLSSQSKEWDAICDKQKLDRNQFSDYRIGNSRGMATAFQDAADEVRRRIHESDMEQEDNER